MSNQSQKSQEMDFDEAVRPDWPKPRIIWPDHSLEPKVQAGPGLVNRTGESSRIQAGKGLQNCSDRIQTTEVEKPFKCAICDKAYWHAGVLANHVKKSHQEPSKKAQDPFKHQKTICSLVSRIVHRSPNEEFVSEALHLFRTAGILDEERLAESYTKVSEKRYSEEQFKIDICNQIFEGFAAHIFKLPPDASDDDS